MLLQFSVTNYRSIKDTAIISLKASTDKSLSDCLISPDEKKQLVSLDGRHTLLVDLKLQVYKQLHVFLHLLWMLLHQLG